ncbi:MAG TPA: glutamyl-tRNA reductase [Ktedonobacterales bacterium]
MIGVIGLDHHRAPMAVRERLAFTGETLREAVLLLGSAEALSEVVILSTCNRTEIYAAGPSWPEVCQVVEAFLTRHYLAGGPASSAPGGSGALSRYLSVREGLDAARHLFCVVAGLRSMQVGESQILGQAKEAFSVASRAGTVGEELHALFTTALRLGKRVRTETDIARADISISAAAVDLARDALGGLAGRSALLIGAGRTNQLCGRLLRAEGVKRLVLVNRTAETAQEVADSLDAEAAPISRLPELIPQVSLILSATAAPHIVLSAATVAQACQGRHTPLVILDLAVPRDVEETAGLLPSVCLYNIDALHGYGERAGRAADLERIEELVDEAVVELHRWQQVRKVAPAIAALRRHVDASQELELARAMASLEHLDEHDREVVRQFGQRMVDKMFHHLVSRVRHIAQEESADDVVHLMMRLFAVPPSPENAAQSSAAGLDEAQVPSQPNPKLAE